MNVFFCRSPAFLLDTINHLKGRFKELIIVAPRDADFSDYGNKTSVYIYALVDGFQTQFLSNAALYNRQENPKESTLLDVFKKVNNKINCIEKDPNTILFSQSPSLETYRQLVVNFGLEASRVLFEEVNDMGVIRNNTKKTKYFNLFISSKMFNKYLLRTSESYYAYKNANFILFNKEREQIKSNELDFSIDLQDGVDINMELKFRFSYQEEFHRNITVLIGQNGNGKSRTLNNIARKALKGYVESESRLKVNRVLLFAPRHELHIFPSEKWKNPATYYRTFPTTRSSKSRSAKSLTESLLDILRTDEKIADKHRWVIFQESLCELNSYEDIHLKGINPNQYYSLIDLWNLKNNKFSMLSEIQQDLEPIKLINGRECRLSSGEYSFLQILSGMTMNIENGSLLLIDEPETHLHPNFISQLMSSLQTILLSTGSFSIIATHSVYVVRDVPEDQIIILERDYETNVLIQKNTGMSTLGANIGSLSTFIFGENGRSKNVTAIVENVLSEGINFSEIERKYGQVFSSEMLSMIKGKIK
ncbi:AAA family ATPase [Pantoea sp. A4]|uniref:AAA family ATPase n=1 Tax=Pantoea sp. A4 TaxID=1225184 RepID=UPI00035F7361|nr:AAA family ATPase [Pantoea sp. A4]